MICILPLLRHGRAAGHGEPVLVHDPTCPRRRRRRLTAMEGERRLDAHEQLPPATVVQEHRRLLPRGLPVPAAGSPPAAAAAGRRRSPQAEEVPLPFARSCRHQPRNIKTLSQPSISMNLNITLLCSCKHHGRLLKGERAHAPGRSHGSSLATSWTTGMTAAGSGRARTFRRRYCTTSSSSVGWNRNPGGSCLGACAGLSIAATAAAQCPQDRLCCVLSMAVHSSAEAGQSSWRASSLGGWGREREERFCDEWSGEEKAGNL